MLLHGDCLDILPIAVAPGSVDLAVVDPPYCSGRDYKISGRVAFTDRWPVGPAPEALISVLSPSPLGSYLSWLQERLRAILEALRAGGTLYIHVDWRVAPWLRVLLHEGWGVRCINEIIWRYRRWPSPAKHYQRMHDTILVFVKQGDHVFNTLYEPLASSTLKQFGGKRQVARFEGGQRHSGRSDEPSRGVPLSDVWDLSILAGAARERTGYPTQKPESLLRRIISVSSNPGDLVLDPMCGSGTTLAVAKSMGRRWIGIDASAEAIAICRERM